MTVLELVPWFQIASTIVAGVGIIVSTALGLQGLYGTKRERELKIKPDLALNTGAQVVNARIGPLTTVHGKAPNDPELLEYKKKAGDKERSFSLDAKFSGLFNYGSGTAFNITVWFEAEILVRGGASQRLYSLQSEPPYSKSWNTVTPVPNILTSGDEASFYVASGCIITEGPTIEEMSGELWIECYDATGKRHRWHQPATYFIDLLDTERGRVTLSVDARA